MGNMSDFLGAGWAFPVAVDARGRVGIARHDQDIEQAIKIIVFTPRGQRMMRPEFGCHIHDLIFSPNNGATAGLAAHYVESALTMWEPRIRVLSVTAAPDPGDRSRLAIAVEYEIKATHDRRSLVFPFYTIPGES
jgi:phage baseplate assembly protein W